MNDDEYKKSMSDLAHRFRYHRPNEIKGAHHAVVRQKCFELAAELNSMLPQGREKSLVFTKLEEVMFWSNAAIARDTGDE